MSQKLNGGGREQASQVQDPRGGRSNGPYADSLPLSSHFQGRGGGLGRGGSGSQPKGGGGVPDPNIYGLK